MNTIEILVPVAPTRLEIYPLAPRPGTLVGCRVAWLDNMKANARALLDAVSATLSTQGAGFDKRADSKNATAAAPEAVMTHLQTCDAVVLAIAD